MWLMGTNSVDYHRQTVVDRADDYPGRAVEYYGSRGETPLAGVDRARPGWAWRTP